MPLTATTTVTLLLFEGCDVMDTGGPYEVLLTANRLAARTGATPPFDVRTVSVDGGSVTAYGGLGLVPSHGALDRDDPGDVVVVPGLIDVEAGTGDTGLTAAIAAAAASATVMASVCTGSFLLDAAGVLGDHAATTHWEDAEALATRRARAGSAGATRDDVRWVDDGAVVTGGALTNGIGMALHLVERFAGRELAEATARQLDFVWHEER